MSDAEPDVSDAALRAEFGWAPLHAFHRMLAAEEGINLPDMRDFGGVTPWEAVSTPTRLLFDLDLIRSPHPVAIYPALTARLREIHRQWSKGRFADQPGTDWLPAQLTVRLQQLIELLDDCMRTGRRLAVR